MFGPSKESFRIISEDDSFGDSFKLLGVGFDVSLSMKDTVDELVAAAGWKMKVLVRTKRFYTDAEMVGLYKAHLLSYLEYRTAAVYHAKRDFVGSRQDPRQVSGRRRCGRKCCLNALQLGPSGYEAGYGNARPYS